MELSENLIEEQKLCRLCGEIQDDVIQLCGEGREDFLTLIKRILGFLNLEFNEDDQMPKWICAACHVDAEITDKFLRMVEEVQRKLRTHFEQYVEKEESAGTLETIAINEKSEKTTGSTGNSETSVKKLQSSVKLHNRVDSEVVFIETLPADIETLDTVSLSSEYRLEKKQTVDTQATETDSTSRKYSQRKRRRTRRFLCDATPYIEADEQHQSLLDKVTDTKGDKSDEVSHTLTIKPIAELFAANGTCIAEMIAVDTDEPQTATPSTSHTDSEIRLVCEYCKEVFTKQNLFLKHFSIHDGTTYGCSACGAEFKTLTELKKHKKLKKHKGRIIRAPSKHNSLKQSTIVAEKESRADLKDATLEIQLDNGGDSDGQIAAIANDDAKAKIFTSEGEQESAADTTQIAETIADMSSTSTKKTAFKCLECNKIYATHYSVLRHHKQVHIGIRSYKCELCNASFKHSTNLTYHMAKHTGIRNYKCDKCSKAFVHKSEMTLHMRTHTGDKPYKCEHCSKGFAHRSNMVTHMRLHSGRLPFKCAICDAKFNSSSHWKVHQEMHLKHAQKAVERKLNEEQATEQQHTTNNNTTKQSKPPLQLKSQPQPQPQSQPQTQPQSQPQSQTQLQPQPQQSTTASTTSLLRPTQTVVRAVQILPPIKAPLPITDGVVNSSELQELIRTSTASASAQATAADVQRPFECAQCLQRFRVKSALTKHLRTHTGEKPYRCPFCPRTFADASNFKRHKTLHKTATQELEHVSKRLKSTNNLLNELQRDKTASPPLPVVVCSGASVASPAHSIASDPDPDGLEAIQRHNTNAANSPQSVMDLCGAADDDDNDDDDDTRTIYAMFDRVVAESMQQLSSTTSSEKSFSVVKALPPPPPPDPAPKSSPRLVCISYPNPANPSDNKMTTFYV